MYLPPILRSVSPGFYTLLPASFQQCLSSLLILEDCKSSHCAELQFPWSCFSYAWLVCTLGAPAHISPLHRTAPHRTDDNSNASQVPLDARGAQPGRLTAAEPGAAAPRPRGPPGLAAAPPTPNGAAAAGRARTRSATARGAVSARIRYDTRQPLAPGAGGAPGGAAPPRDGAHGAAAEAAPPRAGAGRSPRPGRSGLAAGAPGNGGEGARSRYLRERDRPSRRLGSARLGPAPFLPCRPCRARPELLPAAAPPSPAPRSARAPLRSLRRLGPALQDGGASGRDHGGRGVGGPGRCARLPRPPRAAGPAAPRPAPPRSGPAGPLPPAARPRRRCPLWWRSVRASAAPPRPSARPGPALRGPSAHGAGGGAGRRRGAASLLPVAAVHGGAGAAARVPPALVPPHRRGRGARGAAAAGAHPRGKAGAAGRAGPGGTEVPYGACARSWWRRRTCAVWSPSPRTTRPGSSVFLPRWAPGFLVYPPAQVCRHCLSRHRWGFSRLLSSWQPPPSPVAAKPGLLVPKPTSKTMRQTSKTWACECTVPAVAGKDRERGTHVHHYTGVPLGWEQIPTSLFSFSWNTFQSPLTTTFDDQDWSFHTSDLKDWCSKYLYSFSEFPNCLNRFLVSFSKKKNTEKFTDRICYVCYRNGRQWEWSNCVLALWI